ncbi:MAG: aspartyl protease family protein, partial [Candidatus Eisenbacteria bacterium]|nr:aspartyl protease family protein [Candidatus Eisenbacteria bacterium]
PLSDPYEILSEHCRALGGLDRLRGEETIHFEAELTVSGLSGTVRHWEVRPDRSRTEVDLVVFSQTTGDNGSQAWEVDSNGKLRLERDPDALARRGVEARMARFEYLDRDSDVFVVDFQGVEQIEGADCYIVRIASDADDTERDWYIGVDDFLMKKSVVRRPSIEEHSLYYDYRDVGGVLHSFRQEQEILPLGQAQTLNIKSLETDVDIDPALFDPPEDETRDFVFTGGGSSAEIPFQFIEKHLFLPVTIDRRESLWVLDTGASMSVIDRAYAEALGLDISGEIKGEGAGNTVNVAFTSLPSFSVDGIAFSSQRLAVIDVAPLFQMTYGLDVVGILGYDFLSRFVTRVDYANERLTFYDPSTFAYEGSGAVLDAPLSDNLFSVEATVDGVHGGKWMVDLGAGGVTFHAPYAREHDLGQRPGVYGIGFGAGGRISHYFSRFESIEFGGNVVNDPVISVAGVDGEVAGAFAAGEKTGNLGNTLFRHFVLYLDYGDQQIIVERGDDFDKEFPWDRSGLQLWRPEGDITEVLYVSPGTPAEEAGFEEGDTVLTINGVALEHFSGLVTIRSMLRESVGTEYVFGILRDGAPRELTLVLREVL